MSPMTAATSIMLAASALRLCRSVMFMYRAAESSLVLRAQSALAPAIAQTLSHAILQES
jgi:hypothetical protein